MCYWAIYGLGTLVSEEEVFIEKEDMSQEEVVKELLDSASTPFDYIRDGDSRAWIIYTPNYPFHMTDKEKSFTCEEDVAKEMYAVLKPILLPEIDEEWFIDYIDYVNDYGCN